MGLLTQFYRAGHDEPAPLCWGWWHVGCFQAAYDAEVEVRDARDASEQAPRLSSLVEYTFTQDHRFEDPSDGEVLEIHAGDMFRWWRE